MNIVFEQHIIFRNSTEKLVINCLVEEKGSDTEEVKTQAE